MRRPFGRAGFAALMAVFLTVGVTGAFGAAGRHAPSGGGGVARGGSAPAHASGTAGRAGHAPATAQGHATYGYGYYGGYYGGWWPGWGGYPYYGYGWWGPSLSLGFYWGYPYDGYYPSYGYPYYGYPYAVVPGYGGSGPAEVTTDVSPRDAVVRVDGEEVGFSRDYNGSWDVLHVQPGRRAVTFSAPGYMTLTTVLDAKPGRHYQISYALQRGEGADPRSSDRPAPEEPPPMTPPAGATHAEFGSGGPPPPTPSAAPGEGALRTGRLRLHVTPPEAEVYLDGEFLARGSELAALHGAIPVASGGHRLDVVLPGYHAIRKDVEVGVGATTDLALELRKGD